MKIISVDVMIIDVSEKPKWRPIICRINTDEGIYGYGEAAPASTMSPDACFQLIREYADLIIGMNPLENEVIWNKLYRSTYWAQNGGMLEFAAIGAIDIALWDIKGKAFGVPVYKLLGGKFRESLRTYASQLQFGWGDHYTPLYTTDEYVYHALTAVKEGYDSIKIDFLTYDEKGKNLCDLKKYHPDRKTVRLFENRLSAVREAIGDDIDIIVEGHGYYNVSAAVEAADIMKKYRVTYFEEPVTSTPGLYKDLANKIDIPIAGGERIYSRWQYLSYFNDNSIQLIQPDMGNSGGITETKKIADMAYVYDVMVQAHICVSPIAIAAAIQLEAALPNFYIHEHHAFNKYDMNRKLAVYDYQPVNGYTEVPNLPGIGNELSRYALDKASIITVGT